MGVIRRCFHMWLGIVVFVAFGTPVVAKVDMSHVLPEYVAAEDEWFGWTISEQHDVDEDTYALRIDFTSHMWHDTVWQHRLLVVIPSMPTPPEAGVILIAGSGSGRDEVKLLTPLAKQLGMPVGVLLDIPNQPLFGGKNEDELIAFTFQNFLDTGDTSWPLLLPMVKGAVKGMDVFQDAMQAEYGWYIDEFVVAGASKRGWTTWLTPIVDRRVVGIIPVVYNNLDLVEQMALHAVTFPGGTSPKIDDYATLGLHQVLDEEAGLQLRDIVDPYAYVTDITVPKLLIHGTNDEYWPVNALNVYFDDLVGETYVAYVPNGGHSLGGETERVLPVIEQFVRHVTHKPVLPPYDGWYAVEQWEDGVTVRVEEEGVVGEPSLWMALSMTRDFSRATWTELPMLPGDSGWQSAPKPIVNMYAAFFVSVQFATADGDTVRYDSPITLLKDEYVVAP